MKIIDGTSLATAEIDPSIRSMLEIRYAQILDGEPYNYDQHGYMIVVEPRDSMASLEQFSGMKLFHDIFTGVPWNDPDYSPAFEVAEEHPGCFELVYILNDDGFAITVWIPKSEGIDPELLSLCRTYAIPATSPSL